MHRKGLKKESSVLHHIAQASDATRRKHKMLKLGKDTAERTMSQVFKPVITPIEQLVDTVKMQTKKSEEKKSRKWSDRSLPVDPWIDEDNSDRERDFPETASEDGEDQKYKVIASTPKSHQLSAAAPPTTQHEPFPFGNNFAKLKDVDITEDLSETSAIESRDQSLSADNSNVRQLVQTWLSKFGTVRQKELDTEFRIRKLSRGLKIENSTVTFDADTMLLKDKRYELTPGLTALIFMKHPGTEDVTDIDKGTYKEILQRTSAHHARYAANKPIKRNKYHAKLTNIITPLFASPSTRKSGKALLPQYMITQEL